MTLMHTKQMYDYCLTLHLEVKLVWLSSWSYSKILFLLTRYVPMVTAWILLYSEFIRLHVLLLLSSHHSAQIFPNLSLYTCSMLWPASICKSRYITGSKSEIHNSLTGLSVIGMNSAES
jgi:hypothetical protein